MGVLISLLTVRDFVPGCRNHGAVYHVCVELLCPHTSRQAGMCAPSTYSRFCRALKSRACFDAVSVAALGFSLA